MTDTSQCVADTLKNWSGTNPNSLKQAKLFIKKRLIFEPFLYIYIFKRLGAQGFVTASKATYTSA